MYEIKNNFITTSFNCLPGNIEHLFVFIFLKGMGWAEGWAAHRSVPGRKRLGGKLCEPLGKGKGLRLLPKEGRSLALNHHPGS